MKQSLKNLLSDLIILALIGVFFLASLYLIVELIY